MLTLRFWPTVFVLGVAACTLRLGFWQWHRAQDKEARAAQHARYATLKPIVIGSSIQEPEQVIAKSVSVSGYFMPAYTVYLDNRPYQGRAGFYVITPLRIEASASSASKKNPNPPRFDQDETYVLINRGWLPRNVQERTSLAPYNTPAGRVHIQGLAQMQPPRLWAFRKKDSQNRHKIRKPSASTPDIRQNIDPAAYSLETAFTMQPFIIEQHSELKDQLIRDWPVPSQGIERHYGYMVQWWGLTFTVLGFGLYCALRRTTNT